MDGIHAQRPADGKENRGEDKAGRRHVHKGSHNQQQNIDDKKYYIAVGADSQHGFRYSGGDAGEGHDPAHDAGYSDKEDDNGEIDRIRHLPIERLTKSVVSAYFNRIFYSEINNIYQPSASAAIDAVIGNKTISIIFSNNNCTELRQQVNILNEAVYLDNPFVLDSLNTILIRTDETERNTIKKLQRKSDVVEDIVQLELIEDKVQEVLQKINQISSGTLLMDESHSYYYKEREIGERLNINNLSTGLKSFVIIKTLLENGSLKQKDVLILDEPEIHLHPDWQLRYAEIIILLQKVFELTIILTTHSPHFVEALQYYAEKYERDDKCTYYLSEISESGCRFKNVTEDPAEMLSQLVDASIALDKLKFQMEDTKDE